MFLKINLGVHIKGQEELIYHLSHLTFLRNILPLKSLKMEELEAKLVHLFHS